MNALTEKRLIEEAMAARQNSYAPYSHYMVGAAVLTEDGKIYRGCNIENAAFTPTICAERTAIFAAVSEGNRNFIAAAVVTKDGAFPCGVCRQVMSEFSPKMLVIALDDKGQSNRATLNELFPEMFGPKNLGQ